MDAGTLLVTALIAGLKAVFDGTAKKVGEDLYAALKTKLIKKVESNDEARNALIALEKKPTSEGRALALKEELIALKVDQDADLLELAKALLGMLDEQGAKAGKYNITVQNGQGFVIGDGANVTQFFSNKSNED